MYTKIDEELRQYKLFKIQEAESKLRRFKKIYEEIKEHIFIKFSKNISSNILKITSYGLGFLFFIIGLICFFPNEVLTFLESNGEVVSLDEQENFILFTSFSRYLFLGLAVLVIFIGYLLKLNNKKRSNIYNLSKLLEEVIDYMDSSVMEDKKKYEYFIDSITERERKTSNNT